MTACLALGFAVLFHPFLKPFSTSLSILSYASISAAEIKAFFGQTASLSCKGHFTPPLYPHHPDLSKHRFIYHRTLSSHWMTIQLLRTEPYTAQNKISHQFHTTHTPPHSNHKRRFPFLVFFKKKTAFVYTYREWGICFYPSGIFTPLSSSLGLPALPTFSNRSIQFYSSTTTQPLFI